MFERAQSGDDEVFSQHGERQSPAILSTKAFLCSRTAAGGLWGVPILLRDSVTRGSEFFEEKRNAALSAAYSWCYRFGAQVD